MAASSGWQNWGIVATPAVGGAVAALTLQAQLWHNNHADSGDDGRVGIGTP
jgi:hypothetical protein